MNFRFEAENRVERLRLNKLMLLEKQSGLNNRTRNTRCKVDIDLSCDSAENLTPKIAALAETDYSLNGSRARCISGEFVGPRWIPDKETSNCFTCRSEFDWWTRRHHCRFCGKIFCGICSSYQSLLPYAFGIRDPQRVCQRCYDELLPQQTALTNNIANHQRANTVDIISYSLRRYLNFPISLTLGSEIRKAGYSTYNLCQQLYYIRDKTIPLGLFASAKGLAFITVAKGGFMIAPHFGTGLVVALLPNGTWSAPSAIGTCGISYGALIGAEVVDYVFILSSDDAVAAFSGGGQVSIGGSIDLAVGPLGRSGTADLTFGDGGCAAAYAYSHSRGLYAGLSLEGSVMFSRPDVNHRFYGRAVTPSELLKGSVPPPRAGRPLYEALYDATTALSQPTYSRGSLPLSIGTNSISTYGSYSNTPNTSAKVNFGSVKHRQVGEELFREHSGSVDNGASVSSFDTSSGAPSAYGSAKSACDPNTTRRSYG